MGACVLVFLKYVRVRFFLTPWAFGFIKMASIWFREYDTSINEDTTGISVVCIYVYVYNVPFFTLVAERAHRVERKLFNSSVGRRE